MLNELFWDFPLPRTHTGIPLANAITGLLVWGEGRTLKITVSRADLWIIVWSQLVGKTEFRGYPCLS